MSPKKNDEGQGEGGEKKNSTRSCSRSKNPSLSLFFYLRQSSPSTKMAPSRFLLSALAIAVMVSGAAAQGKNEGKMERERGKEDKERGEETLFSTPQRATFLHPPRFHRKKKKTHSFSLSATLLFFFKLSPLSGMQAADARSECTVIAARMQTGPCAKLQDATMVSWA